MHSCVLTQAAANSTWSRKMAFLVFLRERKVFVIGTAGRCQLRPQIAVQCSVLDRFRKMLGSEVIISREIRNCSRNFENSIISSS
jgi:hypothetical protein